MVLVSPNWSSLLAKPDVFVNRIEQYAMNIPSPDGISHSEDLAIEAIAVGLSLVPVFWLTRRFVRQYATSLNENDINLITVAVSGGLFHILSEESGVNNWFLSNSVAAKKSHGKSWRVSQSVSGSKISLENSADDDGGGDVSTGRRIGGKSETAKAVDGLLGLSQAL
jgi:hypothetical protein